MVWYGSDYAKELGILPQSQKTEKKHLKLDGMFDWLVIFHHIATKISKSYFYICRYMCAVC